MTFSNVRDALATRGLELRRGHIGAIDAYVIDNGTELKFLPVSEYDMIDVYHEGLRLN